MTEITEGAAIEAFHRKLAQAIEIPDGAKVSAVPQQDGHFVFQMHVGGDRVATGRSVARLAADYQRNGARALRKAALKREGRTGEDLMENLEGAE